MTIWLFAIGLVSILGQVVLLRELNVAFYGSELIYIVALGMWLLWAGLGAAVGRRRHLPSLGRIRWSFLGFSLLLLLDVAFIRGIQQVFGGVPGADLPFSQQLAAIALALLPIGLTLGLQFQWVAKLFVGGSKTLAKAYGIESVGGVVGGVAATFALKVGLPNFAIAVFCSLLALGNALHLVVRHGKRDHPRVVLAAVSGVVGLFLLTVLWQQSVIDQRLTAWNHPALLATRDTPYGRTTVSGWFGQISVFQNGALAFESEGTSAEEFVHLAVLQHPDPRAMLVLGGGVEGLLREAERHAPERIDYVDLDRRALELALEHLPGNYLESPGSVRARILFEDPRRYLNQVSILYDLILVGMPEPFSAQANRFYTRDFFAQCADRLAPGGVVAFRLQSAENLWTPLLLRRARSIQRALEESFPEVVVLPGATNTFIASRDRLTLDPEVLISRLEEREIRARMVTPAYIRFLYTNDRFAETRKKLEATAAPANTDSRPICYQYTLVIWLSKYYPVLTLVNLPEQLSRRGAGNGAPWFALLGVAVIIWLVRRKPAARRVLLVGIAGFLGMVIESALILNYQVRSGVLFQDLGLLLTVFMAGLAFGSFAVHWIAGQRSSGRQLTRRLGAGLLIAFGGLNGLSARLLSTGAIAGIAMSAAALFLCGMFVAGLFAYASLRRIEDQRWVVSPLYAADLIGGCLGSLAGSLFLIPVLGMGNTALAMVLVAAAALVLV
jgi:spermidine synthase